MPGARQRLARAARFKRAVKAGYKGTMGQWRNSALSYGGKSKAKGMGSFKPRGSKAHQRNRKARPVPGTAAYDAHISRQRNLGKRPRVRTTPSNRSAAMKKAWATRRKKYGKSGGSGKGRRRR